MKQKQNHIKTISKPYQNHLIIKLKQNQTKLNQKSNQIRPKSDQYQIQTKVNRIKITIKPNRTKTENMELKLHYNQIKSKAKQIKRRVRSFSLINFLLES